MTPDAGPTTRHLGRRALLRSVPLPLGLPRDHRRGRARPRAPNLENIIQFEGPSAFAAIILETIPGTAGIMVPPTGFLAGVREICDRYGIVYIADEVMCGFGRPGRGSLTRTTT